MKKLNKKIMLGMGGLVVPIIPLATSISMSTNSNSRADATADFKTLFAEKVNDSTPSAITKELLNKFIASDTYKNEHDWDNLDYNQLYSAMVNIYNMADENNGGFSIQEKIDIGKYVLQENMYRNIFDTIGLKKDVVTNQQQIESATGYIQNPFESTPTKPQNFLIGNRPIELKGNTGHISSFEGLHPNEYMVNFSNQSILEYFLGTVAMSNEVSGLINSLITWRNDVQAGTKTFAAALTEYKEKVGTLLDKYSSTSTTADELISSSVLDIFDVPDVEQNNIPLSDEDLFRAVISGGIGAHLHPLDSQATIDDFIIETDDTERHQKEGEIFNRIRTILRGFKSHDTIHAMENIVNFTPALNDYNVTAPLEEKNANRAAIEKFAALLVKYSGDFTSDVEMRVSGNFVDGHALWIKSGHNASDAWTKVDNAELSTFQNVITDSPLNPKHTWRTLSQSGNANSAITNRTFHQYNVDSKLYDVLQAANKHVMASDDDKWFYMGVQTSFDNGTTWTDFAPRVHLHEVDSFGDNQAHFHNWSASAIKPLVLNETQIKNLSNNNYIKARLTFYEGYTDVNPAETTDFPNFANAIKDYFVQRGTEANRLIDNANHGIFPSGLNYNNYDPTSDHTYDISLSWQSTYSVNYSTGNDTVCAWCDSTYSYGFSLRNTKVGGQVTMYENTKIRQ